MQKRSAVITGWSDICPIEDQKPKCYGEPKTESFLYKRKFQNSELARVCFPTKLGKDSTKSEMLARGVKTRNLIDKDGNRYLYSMAKEESATEEYSYKQFKWKRPVSVSAQLISEEEQSAKKVVRYKRNGVEKWKVEM